MRLIAAILIWLLLALAVGASGALQHVRPPGPQLILLGLTAALLLLWRFDSSVRAQVDSLDLRALIALHLTRFIGFYFLYLCSNGQLACAFAVPAGWGDIAVAGFALVLLIGWSRVARNRPLLLIWNALGLLDILFVVVNAARQALADPASMIAILRLPLNLLPTFLVPLIIASHIIIFTRLWGPRGKTQIEIKN